MKKQPTTHNISLTEIQTRVADRLDTLTFNERTQLLHDLTLTYTWKGQDLTRI